MTAGTYKKEAKQLVYWLPPKSSLPLKAGKSAKLLFYWNIWWI